MLSVSNSVKFCFKKNFGGYINNQYFFHAWYLEEGVNALDP